MQLIAILIFLVIIIAIVVSYTRRAKQIKDYQLPPDTRAMLAQYVPFYNSLNTADKARFEERMRDFLARIHIKGIDVEVQDLDRVLIAAGAIMLIFAFPDWRYNNISEILLYAKAFNAGYSTEGAERNIIGMVGEGAMNGQMILSQPSLRASFQNPEDGHNTVIHEFAHLIDKADGVVDGVPEYLLSRPYLLPWVDMVHKAITDMRDTGHSDINLYGATNPAEFFAVITEYFFERPQELQHHHPDLYAQLDRMFHPAGNRN